MTPRRLGPANERGSITLLGLGFVVVLLFVGGLGLDLWRVVSERRALMEMADAAAAAGANGVDVDVYRVEGRLVLDPELTRALVAASLQGQVDVGSMTQARLVVVTPERVEVEASGAVDLTLLGLFADGVVELTVVAEASPRRGLVN